MSGSSIERVRAALRQAGHPDSIVEFPEGTRTAADAAVAVGCGVAQIAKSIVFRAKGTGDRAVGDRAVGDRAVGDRAVVVIASGANRVDPRKVAAVLGVAVRRADADFVRDATGFAIGGVAPVGLLGAPLLLFDRDLLALHPIWAAAGSPSHVFSTEAVTLLRITGADVADIRQEEG